MYTTIRLDYVSECDSDRLSNYLDSLGESARYVVYEEVAEATKKIHWQGYIECTQESYTVYKESFLEVFRPTHSRFQRSFTVVRKIEEYMKYVAKDKKLFKAKGYDEKHIKEKEEASYKKDKKEKKATFQELVNDWWGEIKYTYVKNNMDMWEVDKVYKRLRVDLVKQFKCLNRVWDVGVIEKYCNYLLMEVVDPELLLKYLDNKRCFN